MADRYWVGGSGYWNSTNTTNWSTTSGGSGGASVPTSTDAVYIDTNSGVGTVTIGTSGGGAYNATCFSLYTVRPITYTNVSNLTVGDAGGATGSGQITINGNVDVDAFNLNIYAPTTGATANVTFTLSGTLSPTWITVYQGRWAISNQGTAGSTRRISGLSGATIVVSVDISVGYFTMESGSVLDFNNSARAITVHSSWYMYAGSSWTNAGGGVSLTLYSTFRDYVGHTYASVTCNGASLTPIAIYGSNTFTSLTIYYYGIKVQGGDTLTVGSITTSGATASTSTVMTTISGTTRFNLSKASGSATISKMVISNVNFTGGATWTADNTSIDAGNNAGITFANTPSFLAFLM